MEPDLVVPSLRATPGLLRAMTGDCPGAQAWMPPATGEWSIGEVLQHLVEGDRDTFLPRLRRMVAEERPRFEGRRGKRPRSREIAALLDAFQAARGEAVSILESLDPAGWRREGVSPSRGPLTIADYASGMARHDTEHLRQIQDAREALGLDPKRAEARVALPLADVLAAITAGPERVLPLADHLTPAQLRHRPRAGDWSMKEVMAHLLKVERDLFLPRLQRMVAEERPRFDRFDPDAWAAERDHRQGDFFEDWRAFRAARLATVAFLGGLPSGSADRIGLSGFFGTITLAQYATHIVDHDIEHLGQLARCREAALREASPGARC